MAKGLRDLAKRLNKLADNIEAAPSKVAALFAYDLVQQLIIETPVDTSKALSNWLLSLDDPVLIDMDAYVLGIAGSTASVSSAQALAHNKSILDRKQPGQETFISNSAGYIRDLNNGSSKQAPAGFVESCISRVRAQLPRYIKQAIKNGR